MRWALSALLLPAIASATQPTYKDVAPILERHCVRCHRAGDIAPMPLETFRQVRPWTKAILDEVLNRSMPPWHADPKFGTFSNDPRLSTGEIEKLVGWIAAGAPEGAPRRAKPTVSPEGWHIRAPDVQIELPQAVEVPAKGQQRNLYFTVPSGFTEDRWVSAIEIVPGNRAVVHHITVFFEPPRDARVPKEPAIACTDTFFEQAELRRQREHRDEPALWRRHYLFSWTPGTGAFHAKANEARLIPAQSKFVFEVHYAPNGVATTDRSRLAMVFAKGPIKNRLWTLVETNEAIGIPPGEPNYEATACILITREVTLLALKPHMHLRGRDFRFEVEQPDRKSETLLYVPKWDFNWQHNYLLATPLQLRPGARIRIVAHYDNSAKNRANPDPTRFVVWDEQSTGEMLAGMITVSEPTR